MNPMNLKRRFAVGALLGAVFVFLEFLTHGVLLRDLYMETSAVWRPESEMKALFGLMPAAEFIFGLLFGIVYAQGYEPRRAPLGQGLRYGLIMGLMIAPLNSLVWYVILPIPQILCVAWFVAGFVQMLIMGVVASFVYKPAQ